MDAKKKAVLDFWDQASCGEALYLSDLNRDAYLAQARQRYALEPYIEQFADFSGAKGKKVLEIGVGLGADHQRFAEAGAKLWGIDLTPRAIEHARRRFSALGLDSNLSVGDAENLSFDDSQFDIVYSWGVLHHSPDTPRAVSEAWRVLRPDGVAKIMIYHKWSLVGYMLWLRYALMTLRPWLSLEQIYSRYLESPGTKAYSVRNARKMFSAFRSVDIGVVLTHGDLLESAAGQRHQGSLLAVARRVWPRKLLKRWAKRHGLFMMIRAIK
jgi:ubiquinone/menaquinone biosynthesis C-methylase UbiE